MARAIIIHRRDLGNVVYSPNPSYNPPNDNTTIDDFGNTKSMISVPVRFPSTLTTEEGAGNSEFVWAGNKYNVESISIDQLTGAFNLPNDINDARLTKNSKYERIEPHFSVNIAATTSSIYTSHSTIPSLTPKKLVMIIPVYIETDYKKLNAPTSDQTVPFVQNTTSGSGSIQMNNFSMFSDSEFYGFIGTSPSSSEQMIQVIPKKLCVIPRDSKLDVSLLKKPWNHSCPSNPRKLSRTDVVCRTKNTSEIAGYNQGIITYYSNTGSQNTNFTENTRILNFRPIPFREDPVSGNIPLQTPDGIPVELEGEGVDGSTRKFRVVVDEAIPSLALTDTGTIVYATIVLLLGSFVIVNLPINTNLTLLSILLLVSVVSSIIIYFHKNSFSEVKLVSFIGTICVSGVILALMIVSTFAGEFMKMIPGAGNVILFGIVAITTATLSFMIAFTNTRDQETKRKNYYLGTIISYIPKIIVLGLLLFSNPLGNILGSIGVFTGSDLGKQTAFSLHKGLEKILNQGGKIDFTDTDIASFLQSMRKKRVDNKSDALITQINDEYVHAYYSKTVRDSTLNRDVTTVKSSYGTIDEGGNFVKSTKSRSVPDDYQMVGVNNTSLYNLADINHRGTFIIMLFLIVSIFLILLQPTPFHKDGENDTTLRIGDIIVSSIVSIVIFILLTMMKYQNQIGIYVFIPFTIGIIANLVINWTSFFTAD